jgi:hypothetical protein
MKRKRQGPWEPTMVLDEDLTTKILDEEGILAIATQPPKFCKKYTRYFNKNGKIRP